MEPSRKPIRKAYEFAAQAHASIGQVRKYTGEPYIVHPVGVAALVSAVTSDQNMIAAALLHDTVEDTPVTLEEIDMAFGSSVARLVDDLTDISTRQTGNRSMRKALDREHTANASVKAKTIKLADVIHNCRSILLHDKNFAIIYLNEKRLLLDEALQEGNPTLWYMADRIVRLGQALIDR